MDNQNLKHYIYIIKEYLKLYSKMFMKSHRLLLFNTISSISFQILNIILILSIYKYNKIINGWEQFELLFLFSFVGLIVELSSFITAGIYRLPRMYIHEGNWDMLLIYPYSPLTHLILRSLSISRILNVISSLALMIISGFVLKLELTYINLLVIIISIISSVTMLVSITIFLGATAFKLKSRYSLATFINFLLSFSKYPITFFNMAIHVLLTYFIPVNLFIDVPMNFILGKGDEISIILMLPIISCVLAFISIKFFNYMAKSYITSGSN